MSRAKVFISYAHPDVEPAQRLYYNLKESGHDPWLDSESLLPGKNWKIEIRKAMKDCRYFIALISSQSVTKRGYVQKELKLALDILEEFPPGSIYVIPARLNRCESTDERLQELHRVDLFPNWDIGVKRILRTFESEAKSELSGFTGSILNINHRSQDYGNGLSDRLAGPVNIISDVWTCQVCGEPYPTYAAYSEHFRETHQ